MVMVINVRNKNTKYYLVLRFHRSTHTPATVLRMGYKRVEDPTAWCGNWHATRFFLLSRLVFVIFTQIRVLYPY